MSLLDGAAPGKPRRRSFVTRRSHSLRRPALLATAVAAWCASPIAVPTVAAAEGAFTAGQALAEKYCTACHLLPDPASLTKLAWAHHIQPEMAKWLGLERVDYEGMPDGRLLEEAKLFPPSPIVPQADWFAIWDYYRAAAPSEPRPQAPKPPLQMGLKQFTVHRFNPAEGAPMMGLVRIDTAAHQIQAGDAISGVLFTLNGLGDVLHKGRFSSGPVSIQPGDRRSFVTLIGRIFPSDALEGAVVSLPPDPSRGAPRTVLSKLRRPTDALAADLNRDGREDLAVCQFGNRLGQFSWFENRGDGQFVEHILLDRPGAMQVRSLDLNRDGHLDLIVMVGQAREGVYLFLNDGRGNFEMTALIEKPPSWGFAGFDLTDFNRDGRVDLLAANGDNGDFALPLKAHHGIRLYLNEGTNRFTETFFYPLHGAYKAIARDFDGDGDHDIAAIAYYADYSQDFPESFVYLENQGGMRFQPRSVPEAQFGRWMTMDAGDLDADGDEDLVLGSFVRGPTTIPVPAAVRDKWQSSGAAVLYLENRQR